MWQQTTRQEHNKRIFEEEIDPWLPEDVLDFHVHVTNRKTLPDNMSYACAGHEIAKYDFEDLEQDLASVYPRRHTWAVCFGSPNAAYDMVENNRYIAAHCDNKRFFGFRLYDPHETDYEHLFNEMKDNGYLGLKPYLNYVTEKAPRDVEIHDMLPQVIMETANKLGAIIMLHIPRNERLADKLNRQQIEELCIRYPTVKIVLAHIGRAYFLKNITGNLDRLKDLPNLYYDLAMLNNAEVLEYLFQNVPAGKILYATDIPIALAPGKSVEINDQYTYVTPIPWKLSISDDHCKLVFTSFLYEELRAIKKACNRLSLTKDFVRHLFYDNGMALLKSAINARSSA